MRYKNSIIILLISCINFLFLFKYSTRVLHSLPLSFTVSALTTIGIIAIFLKGKSVISGHSVQFARRAFFILAAGLGLFLISIVIFTPEQSNVTRLPAIKIWLGNLMQGIFPYKSPVNPSGFPGLFLLAMPFYLMGLAQVLCIFGYVIFIFFLRISERNEKSASTVLLLLALSPMLFYEVMVRSELLLNGALLLLLYSITKKNLQKDSISPQFIAAAAGFGFLLSTRLTAWPITAILVLPLIGSRLNKFFVFTGISLGVFALTLIPFLAWDYNYFMHSGPFAIQSLYLPGWFMLCAGLFALAVAGKLQAEKESFFFTGVFLFILVAVSFSIHISQNGIFNSLFERPLFDISYFILALPFLVSAYDTAGTK